MKRPSYAKNDLVAEMARTTQDLGLKADDIFGKASTTKTRQLFEYYLAEHGLSDDAAIRKMYGPYKSPYPPFVKTKYELKRTLRAALLAANPRAQHDDRTSARIETYLECQKELSLFWILRNSGRLAPAAELGERLLPKLVKMDFADLALRLVSFLARFHAVETHDAAKTRHYLKLFRELLDRFYWDSKSDAAISELGLPLTRSWGTKPEMAAATQEKVDEMVPQLRHIESPLAQGNIRLVNALHHSNNQKWPEAVEICREAIAYFRSQPPDKWRMMGSFYSNLIISLTHLGRYAEAKKASDEQFEILRHGSSGWFAAIDAHATLCFRSGDYEAAQEAVLAVRKQEVWENLQPTRREIWHIFEAWLAVLHRAGELDELKFEFRKSRFLNQVPEFSKDKRGMNINLILVQILLLLQDGHWEAVTERFDALGKYNYRMVRKAGQYRSFHFIRMALSIPRVKFQRIKAQRLADKFIPLVQRVPSVFIAEKQDLEIIEFEKIWEIMREMLPQKPAQLRKAA